MPALKNFSAAEEEDDQLCPNSEAYRFNPEAVEEEEEDLIDMDEKDEDDDMEVEDDIERNEDEEEEEEEEEDEEEEEEEGEALEEEDSKRRSRSPTPEEESDSEFMEIDLAEIRRAVQCPICLGIIKKTRTVMECLHRFCRVCIDKSMRLGNNECPACRKHCASRRSLRDDPKFDAFIAALFNNIERFEEEELAFHDDDKARKKQIQVSIAQVSQRQSEALVKRKVLPRTQRIGSGSRRRRNCRNMEHDTVEAHDDDDDDNNNGGKDSSSDEPCAEIQQRKRRKRSTTRSTTHPYSSSPKKNDNCANNGTEEIDHRDNRGISPGLVWNAEMLTWGRGGTRSNTRQGNNNNHQGANSKNVRNSRLNTLVEYLGSLESDNAQLDIHLKLVTKRIPKLPDLHLCCRPTLVVKQLREYVALQMQLKTEEVELFVCKEDNKTLEKKISSSLSLSTENMQSLEDDDETLAKLKVDYFSSHDYLIVIYRQNSNRVAEVGSK